MDLDDALRAARPDDAPPPDITARHREQLRQIQRGVDHEHTSGDDMTRDVDAPLIIALTERTTRRRRTAVRLAAAAATALIAAGGVVLMSRDTEGGPATQPAATNANEPAAPRATPRSTPTGAIGPTCSGELPIDVTVGGNDADVAPGTVPLPSPDDGPTESVPVTDGAAPSSPPLRDGQQAWHWPRENSTIEVRWPADSRPLYDLGAHDDPADSGFTASAPEGRNAPRAITIHAPFDVEVVQRSDAHDLATPCDTVQISRYADGARSDSFGWPLTGERGDDALDLIDLHPLITTSRDVEVALTEVVPCRGGPGSEIDEHPAGAAHPTPAEALDAYVALPEAFGLSDSDWTEMKVPDGTVVYGQAFSSGNGFTQLITVTETDAGWRVSAVRRSGC